MSTKKVSSKSKNGSVVSISDKSPFKPPYFSGFVAVAYAIDDVSLSFSGTGDTEEEAIDELKCNANVDLADLGPISIISVTR